MFGSGLTPISLIIIKYHCKQPRNYHIKSEKDKYYRNSFICAAKSLQSCPTLCDPIDGSPTGFPVPGILQARTLEWVAISFSNAWKWKVKVKSLSRVWLLATPWTAAYQAPPSMGISRQEYWSGVPLPSPIKPIVNLNKCLWLLLLIPWRSCLVIYLLTRPWLPESRVCVRSISGTSAPSRKLTQVMGQANI